MLDRKSIKPGGRANTINDAIRCQTIKTDGERCRNYAESGECPAHKKARTRSIQEADRRVESQMSTLTQ